MTLLLAMFATIGILHAESLQYVNNGVKFEAPYFKAKVQTAPGLLLIPGCQGITAEVLKTAQRYQEQGYNVLVADIYGDGVRPVSELEGSKIAAKYKKDRAMLLQRARLAFDELVAQPGVDKTRLATVGYKFGGLAAVELGRSIESLRAIIAIQTSLDDPKLDSAHAIRGKFLALQPAQDPYILKADVDAFVKEMQIKNVDYEFVTYGTLAYDRAFDRSSEFLNKILAK